MRIFRSSLAIALTVLVMASMLGSGCTAPAPAPTLTEPTPAPNLSPIISSLTAKPSAVLYGDSSTITCIATDPDYDPIEYIWSASEGAITGSGKEIIWVAPNKDGNFNITITVKDKRGGQTTGNVTVTVSAPVKTITIEPIATETGTVNQKNATDYSRTRAGDDAQNIGYRAFWSFDISKLAGKDIQNASLKFTTGSITGKPFSYQLPYGLGGLLLWKTNHGTQLPEFGYVGSMLSNAGPSLEPPDVVDVTTDIKILTSYSVSRFQVEALFEKVSNGSSTAQWIEWSSVVLEVTYSDR